MTLGFRILPRERAVSADVVARFLKLPVANVSDSMSRMTAAGSRLTRMHRDGQMAGPPLLSGASASRARTAALLRVFCMIASGSVTTSTHCRRRGISGCLLVTGRWS